MCFMNCYKSVWHLVFVKSLFNYEITILDIENPCIAKSQGNNFHLTYICSNNHDRYYFIMMLICMYVIKAMRMYSNGDSNYH